MEQMITKFAGLGIVGLIGGYLFTTFMKERAEERIYLVRRLYDRGMNSAQISELIGLDKEQVEEMLQTKSNFENNG